MKNYNLNTVDVGHLELLAKEYYETKDDYWFTERYESSKSFAENEIDLFIEWIKNKNENISN